MFWFAAGVLVVVVGAKTDPVWALGLAAALYLLTSFRVVARFNYHK